MAFTKEQLLAHLRELEIDFSQYEHPVVLTVEAQAKYVGDKGGELSKNLFLKDKKSRFYIVSALADTKVDLKILSQRLGLGKGGIRMAPEDALGEILQVPLGCVTPFALINETARHVSLLLDKGFKSQKCCFFHPLSNDMSISLSSHDLDKFLKSIGREPSYVDLEDNPPVGKDQPPDLAALVPSGSTIVPELSQTSASSEGPVADPVSADQKPSFAKDSEPIKAAGSKSHHKEESSDGVTQPSAVLDAGQFVQQFLNKISVLSLSEITEDTIKQNGGNLGSTVADSIRKHLGSDLNSLAMMFRNASYTQGFYAAYASSSKMNLPISFQFSQLTGTRNLIGIPIYLKSHLKLLRMFFQC